MDSISKEVVGMSGGRGGLFKSMWRSRSGTVNGVVCRCLAITSGTDKNSNSPGCISELLKGARWTRGPRSAFV